MDVSVEKTVEKMFALEFLSGLCGIAVDERLMIKEHAIRTDTKPNRLCKIYGNGNMSSQEFNLRKADGAFFAYFFSFSRSTVLFF